MAEIMDDKNFATKGVAGAVLDLANIRNADGMIDVDEAEMELLEKSEGYEMLGVRFCSEDVHKLANILRRM